MQYVINKRLKMEFWNEASFAELLWCLNLGTIFSARRSQFLMPWRHLRHTPVQIYRYNIIKLLASRAADNNYRFEPLQVLTTYYNTYAFIKYQY